MDMNSYHIQSGNVSIILCLHLNSGERLRMDS